MKHFALSTKVRDFIVLVSLSNIFFLAVWRELIFANPSDSYWLPSYTSESYVAIIINVFGIAALMWLCAGAEGRFGNSPD